MVAFLSVVALLSFCTLSRYFQTVPGSCLQTILGMEKGRLSKHRKENQTQTRCSQSHQDHERGLTWAVSAQKPQTS